MWSAIVVFSCSFGLTHLCALLEPLLLLGDQHHTRERLGHLGTQRVRVLTVIVILSRISRHVALPITIHKLSVSASLPLPDPGRCRMFHDPATAPAAAAAATRLVQRFSGIAVDAAATVQWQLTEKSRYIRTIIEDK